MTHERVGQPVYLVHLILVHLILGGSAFAWPAAFLPIGSGNGHFHVSARSTAGTTELLRHPAFRRGRGCPISRGVVQRLRSRAAKRATAARLPNEVRHRIHTN